MKKKILILILAILAVTLCFAACTPSAGGDDNNPANIKSIEIVPGTAPTSFVVGQQPNYSTLKVRVTYEDGTTKDLNASDVQISDIDTSTTGEKTVTVTYNGFTTTFKVTVNEKGNTPGTEDATLESISIIGNVPTTVKRGEVHNVSELQVLGTYSNGTAKTVPIADVTIDTVDTSSKGVKTLTVTYQGKTATMNVTVIDITGIKLIGSKIELNVGDTLNTNDLKFEVSYEDGTTKQVEAHDVAIVNVDTSSYGEQELKVTYAGFDAFIKVNVVGPKSISVMQSADFVTTVKVFSTFDPSNIKVQVTYSDDSEDHAHKEVVDIDNLTVGTVDTSTPGVKTLEVKYGNLTATVDITVIGVESMTVNGVKSEMFKGEALDKTAISATVVYTNGNTETVSDLTVGTLDTATAGEKKLTVTYLDKTVDCVVKVCEVTDIVIEGVPATFQAGKPLDISKMKVFGVYNDSKSTKVELPAADITTNIDDIDINAQDDKELVIKYNGAYGTFEKTVTVGTTAPELVGIIIKDYAASVRITEKYNSASVSIIAKYGNNTQAEIPTGFTVSEINTDKAGEQTLTVTYEGEIATATVTVVGVKDITVISGVKNELLKDREELDVTGIVVKITYTDDSEKNVEYGDEKLVLGTIDATKAGEQKLSITYCDKTVDYTVTVCDITEISVSGAPTHFVAGEEPDFSGMKVYAVYSNGARVDITKDAKYTIDKPDFNVEETKTITVTYLTFTADITLGAEPPVLDEIVIGAYDKTVKFGQTYNKSSVTVIAKYGNNTQETIGVDNGLTVSDIATDALGKKTLTLTFEGKEITVEVNVIGVKTMTVVEGTVAKEILKGQSLKTDSIKVNVTYTDESVATVAFADLTVGSVDASTAGDKTLTVKYLDKTIEYTVKVCQITNIRAEGIDTEIQAGNTLDLSKMIVYGIYNDTAKTEVLLSEGVTAGTVNTNTEGVKKLTITYAGKDGAGSYEVNITVTAPAFNDIEIRNYPTSVRLDGAIDPAQIIVYAKYANGTDKQVTGFTVSDVDTSSKGEKTVTVTYSEGSVEKTATFKIKVLGIKSIAVVTDSIKSVIYKGETLDVSGVKVIVTFEDDTTDTVTEGITVTGHNALQDGVNNTLKVTYKGVTTDFVCHVKTLKAMEIFSGLAKVKRDGYATDVSELKLKLTYSNGDEEIYLASTLTGVTYTGLEEGNYNFSVSYQGITISKTLKSSKLYQVHALNGTVPGYVFQGDKLSYKGFKLTVVYQYDTGKKDDKGNPIYDEEIFLVGLDDPLLKVNPAEDAFDTSEAGDKLIQFTYKDVWTASAKVIVKGVASIEIVRGTVLETVNKGQDFSTETLQILVKYTDGTSKHITRYDPYIEEVSSIDTNTVGKKTLTVTYKGKTATLTVEVVEVSDDGVRGDIIAAVFPDDILVRESYQKNFKNSNTPYYVGNDNPFILYLNVAELDANDKLIERDGKSIPTQVKVFENGVELTDSKLAEVVSFNSAKNSYQFTEAAKGRTFTLEVAPADIPVYVDYESVKNVLTVTIVDGYNIYHAYELNIINNGNNTFENLSQEGDMKNFSQKEVIANFLTTKGIDPNTYANLAGVVLHKNIDVKPEDLPPEYIVNYTKDGKNYKGLVDWVGIFTRQISTNSTFSIYGNCFSLFSYNIPAVCHKGIANNEDNYSNAVLFEIEAPTAEIKANGAQEPYLFETRKFNVVDLALRDNDPHSNDQSASERHMRGLVGFQVGGCVVNMENVNIDAFMTSMSTEEDNLIINLNKVKFYNAWQGHLFLWSNNSVQETLKTTDDAPLAGMFGIRVNITDSLLAKCGGPVILAQNANRELPCNKGLSVDVVADEKCELYSYVTGEEAWFVAVNQVPLAKKILLGDGLIRYFSGGQKSYTSTKFIKGISTVNMIMVCMGGGDLVGGNFADHRGSLTIGGQVALNMKIGEGENQKLKETIGTPGADTIFQSASTGATAYNPEGQQYLVNPTAELFGGKYLNIYTAGIGIALEYYEPIDFQ